MTNIQKIVDGQRRLLMNMLDMQGRLLEYNAGQAENGSLEKIQEECRALAKMVRQTQEKIRETIPDVHTE